MATDDINAFISNFHVSIKGGDLTHINSNYENWNRLTDKYFKQSEWPRSESISNLLQDDKFSMILYRELWHRHYYSKLAKELTLEIRVASWKNYCSFFDALLAAKRPVHLVLPTQWLWDICDEFIYQFQEFSQFRSKINDRSQDEVEAFQKHSDSWNTVAVFKYLHRLVEKSEIKKTLECEKKGLKVEGEFAKSQVYSYLGYWSIIGLCRLNVILGDYHLALKTLEPIQIHKKARYTQVTAAYITLYYYLGFTYMVLRRYHDAIKTFVTVLLYISRSKQFQTRQYDVKKNDQMYALLAVLLTLCPKRIDEHIGNILKQEHHDKVSLAGTTREIEQLFSYACPKFVLPSSSWSTDGEEIGSYLHAITLQRNTFIREIHQQALLPTIMSYLKLYSSIGVEKLCHLLDDKVDQETLRTHLLCLSHKSYQQRWSEAHPSIEGDWESCTNIDIWVDGDMIHITDNTEKKSYAKTFLRNSNRLEEIIRDIETK